MNVEGCTALITGASRGLGRALAQLRASTAYRQSTTLANIIVYGMATWQI
jgi:NAD(P)-dependent dehydrogenase (short-subunit alcohol dehydrogenase family)